MFWNYLVPLEAAIHHIVLNSSYLTYHSLGDRGLIVLKALPLLDIIFQETTVNDLLVIQLLQKTGWKVIGLHPIS